MELELIGLADVTLKASGTSQRKLDVLRLEKGAGGSSRGRWVFLEVDVWAVPEAAPPGVGENSQRKRNSGPPEMPFFLL